MQNKKQYEKIIGVKELRENLEKYISQVNKGDSFIVVKRSKPVFKITPLNEETDQWETVVDFTKIKKHGVCLKDARNALSCLDK